MISEYTHKKVRWIDVESPTKEEISHLADVYNLPGSVAEELLTSTMRSKVDLHNNLIYLILHFPKYRHKEGELDQEIDFIIGKDYVMTVHYELINPLHEFSKKFEVNKMLDRGIRDEHAGYLFYSIIKELYRDSLEELDDINKSLRDVEHDIFGEREEDTVHMISKINRRLLDFKQAIRFHREVLHSFEIAGRDFFGESFTYHLSGVIGEYNKVQTMLDGHKDILNDLRDTNDSLLTTKTNETIKVLTIMSFIMLPLTLITGVFGMNTDFIIIKQTSDFFVVVGAMTVTGLTMFLYFKLKRWM